MFCVIFCFEITNVLCDYVLIFKISKKEIIKKPVNLLKLVNKNVGNNSFAVMDMGGYFSYPYGQLFDFFNGKLVGIVEDTENGHKNIYLNYYYNKKKLVFQNYLQLVYPCLGKY